MHNLLESAVTPRFQVNVRFPLQEENSLLKEQSKRKATFKGTVNYMIQGIYTVRLIDLPVQSLEDPRWCENIILQYLLYK
jgi:hypothetical protein